MEFDGSIPRNAQETKGRSLDSCHRRATTWHFRTDPTLFPSPPLQIKYGDSKSQDTEPVSTLNGYLYGIVSNHDGSSLYLDSAARLFRPGPYR